MLDDIDTLKPISDYMYNLLWNQYLLVSNILRVNNDFYLDRIFNQFIFIVEKFCDLFVMRTAF